MLTVAWSTARAIYSLVRLEQAPYVLPVSMVLLSASLAVYGASEFGLAVLEHGAGPAALAGFVAVVLLGALTTGALFIEGYGARTVQTLTALAAGGSIVDISRIGLRLLLRVAVPVIDLAPFLLAPLVLWHFLIYAHIFRHALTGRAIHAFGLAFASLLLLFAARMTIDTFA
jgi:hypothetical protein